MAFRTVVVDAKAARAASTLGSAIAARLLEMQAELKLSPLPNGLDYEPYHGSRDNKFRTARINDGFRALIWELDTETVYIFDVGNHEDAQRAAKRLTCRVDGVTRDLRIVEMVEANEAGDGAPTIKPTLLPPTVSDHTLRQIGLRDEEILIGRSLVDVQALDALVRLSPSSENAAHAIQLVAEGYTMEEVYAEVSALPPVKPSTEDFGASLLYTLQRQKLTVLATEEELKAALDAPWDNWKTWLHPTQREIAYKPVYKGPCRVSGGPGTGKTIVAIHRVRALLEATGMFGLEKPILLTTFNTTMADQLVKLIDDFLSPGQRKQVVVKGLDQLVYEKLIAKYPEVRNTKILYDKDLVQRARGLSGLSLLGIDPYWLVKFWQQVLLSMPEHTHEAYVKLRQSVKSLPSLKVEAFNAACDAAHALEQLLERRHETTFLLRARMAVALDLEPTYSHIVVDEAQDCHALHWRLLRKMVPLQPNDIFLVSDSDQRIYRTPFPLLQSGIDIRGRSRRLTASYRCSKPILDFAYRILGANAGEDPDLDDTPKRANALMSGLEPATSGSPNADGELARLVSTLQRWNRDGIGWGEILVSCCKVPQISDVVGTLSLANIPAQAVDGTATPAADRVNVMTMHRAKGMEARGAVVFGAGKSALDPTSMDPADVQRNRLALFVAATRARERLFVSWHGEPSPLLAPAL